MSKTHFAIIDNNAGRLQYVDRAESAEAALAAFVADTGVETDGSDMTTYHISAEQADAVWNWWTDGAAAAAFPLFRSDLA